MLILFLLDRCLYLPMFDTKKFIKGLVYDAMLLFALSSLIFRFGASYSGVASGSMEGTVLTGDKVVLMPFIYGGKTPKTVLAVPFIQQPTIFGFRSYLRLLSLPVYRAPGRKPKQGEVVTFRPTICDEYGTYSEAEKAQNKKQQKLVQHPRDTRTPFLKRIVAKAGDRVRIDDTQVLVNGAEEDKHAKYRQYRHMVTLSDTLSVPWLEENTNGWNPPEFTEGKHKYELVMTLAQKDSFEKYLEEKSIKLETIAYKPYEGLKTTEGDAGIRNDMKEIVVPYHYWNANEKKYESLTIELNKDTHPVYIATIQNTDKNFQVEKKDNEVRYYLNGKQIFKYTFKENFFFPIGDNFHDSRDGRSFGFVPYSHLDAKAYRVIFNYQSWRAGKGWRFFHKIPTGIDEPKLLLFFVFFFSLLFLIGGMWFIARRFD